MLTRETAFRPVADALRAIASRVGAIHNGASGADANLPNAFGIDFVPLNISGVALAYDDDVCDQPKLNASATNIADRMIVIQSGAFFPLRVRWLSWKAD